MSAFYKNTITYSYLSQLYLGSYSQVSIFNNNTTQFASIFLDKDLQTSLNQPLIADNNGNIEFWIDDGIYDFQLVFTQGTVSLTSTIPNQYISDPSQYYQLNNTSTITSFKYVFSEKGLILHDTSSNLYYKLEIDANQLSFVPIGPTLDL